MVAYFQLSGIEQSGTVKKLNAKTVLVELVRGETIKRHIVKHNCVMSIQKEITFPPVVKREKLWTWFVRWIRREA